MDNNELRKLLQQLHDEIKNIRTVDEKGNQLLRDLDDDIHTLLDRSEESSIQLHPSFVQRLEGTLYHFEVTHPNLTTLISRLLDSLSNAGIWSGRDPGFPNLTKKRKEYNVLDFDELAARCYGHVRVSLEKAGQRLSDLDLQIAGIALAWEADLVTHNQGHFVRLVALADLKLEDWLSGKVKP